MNLRTYRGICMALFAIACLAVIYGSLARPNVVYQTGSDSGLGPGTMLATARDTGDVFSDPYVAPVNAIYAAPQMPAVSTRRMPNGGAYTQTGVLVSESNKNQSQNALILPLFGRQIDRSKFQYYALSNTGAVNTKLPVRIANRRCTGEYGCDEISNGDNVFVEGYGDIFIATIYDSPQFSM